MKLSQLILSGFRCYRNVTFDLGGPHVLFSGVNGSGKTSVREAIRWVLTGHCANTDGKGAGAEVLIPTKARVAEASVVIDGIGKITRTYAEKGGGSFSVEGFTGSSSIQQQALYTKLNTQASFLDAVLSTDVFLDLGHAEAKSLVLGLLDVKIDVVTGPNDPIPSYTLDELDVHFKQAFEDRKLAKRDLANWVVPPKPEGNVPPEDAITAQLTKLRTQMGTLQQAIGKTLGSRTALQAELERVVMVQPAEDHDYGSEIQTLEAQIVAAEAVIPVEPAKGDPQRLAFLRNRAEAIAAVPDGDTCVVHPDIPCATAVSHFHRVHKAIQSEIAALEQAERKKAPTALQSPLMGLRAQLRTLQAKHAAQSAQQAAFQKAQEREHQIQQELAGLPNTDAQELDLAALQTRIAKGEAFLKDARAHWAALAAHEKTIGEKIRRQAEVDRLEALVEVLGPNGARVPALKEAMGRFESAVNPYVKPFEWTLSFSVDPWEVRANGRPVETYSRSEQYRIGIALQLGIAQLSGLRFACVDEIDMLDLENRALVTKMLLVAELDQILVLGTREPSQALPKGCTAFRLSKKDEHTVVAERSAA